MLVLTRKLLEKLYIGDDICVTVVRLEGGQVRLGIEAPRQISVLRGELRPHTDDQADSPAPEKATTKPLAGRFRPNRPVPLGTDSRRREPSR